MATSKGFEPFAMRADAVARMNKLGRIARSRARIEPRAGGYVVVTRDRDGNPVMFGKARNAVTLPEARAVVPASTWNEPDVAPTHATPEPESFTVDVIPPGAVRVGPSVLPGGVAFALQADRPEMLTPGLCGVARGVAGWSEPEQRGVLMVVHDLMVLRTELHVELVAAKRRARKAERRLHTIALHVRAATQGFPVPSDDDDSDLDDDEGDL